VHVQSVGLHRADDTARLVRGDFDRLQNLVIVTKDADFQERSLIAGAPPKVVWIRRGNCPASDIESNLKYIAPGATL
jgi:predicted nuclease of predicted toxin-antitoxin system